MPTVILAWKALLIRQLELGKPLREAASLTHVGIERINQERNADPDFGKKVDELASRPTTRPSW